METPTPIKDYTRGNYMCPVRVCRTVLKLSFGVILYFPYFHISIRRDNGSLLLFYLLN